jgi:transcriptional regulator with XRE-family HTH domain
MTTNETFTQTLRRAILAYSSRYQLSKDSGVEASVLSRFVNGKLSVKLDTVERLAPVLGLRLVAVEPTAAASESKSSRRRAKSGAKRRVAGERVR